MLQVVVVKRWGLALGIIAIIALGSWARFYELGEKSLWSDEVATIASSFGNSIDPDAYQLRGESFDPIVTVPAKHYHQRSFQSHGAGNFGQTAHVLKSNVHPPLFFWFMNLWMHWFGTSPDTMRMPAVIFGILNIPLLYFVANQLLRFNRAKSRQENEAQEQASQFRYFPMLASALMAFSTYQISHAQDARQYTFVIFLSLLCISLVLQIVMTQRQRWAAWLGLGALLAIGLYTQYFFMVFTGFILGSLIWQCIQQKALWPYFAGTLVVIGVLLLPWIPYFQEQMVFCKTVGHFSAGLWKPLPMLEKVWRILCEFLLMRHKVSKFYPLLILLVSIAAYFECRKLTRSAEQKPWWVPSPMLGFILLWLGALLGGQILLDILKNSHTVTIRRYLILSSPVFYLLTAYLLLMIGRIKQGHWRLAQVGITVLLFACMAKNSVRYLFYEHTSSDELKQAAYHINRTYQPGDVVLVNKSGAITAGMAYYLKPEIHLLGLDIPKAKDLYPGSLRWNRVQNALAKRQRIWLVTSHTGKAVKNKLFSLLSTEQRQLSHFRYPGVNLTLSSLPESTIAAKP